MVIDSNLYWFPEELFTDEEKSQCFLSEIPVAYGIYGRIEELSPGRKQYVIEKPKGSPNLNYVQGDYQLEKQLSAMDKGAIDHAVLKLSCQQEWMSLDTCREFNTLAAEHARQSGGKMTALAAVPPWGRKDFYAELDRCFDDLGMTGVQLSAHYGNLYLDDEAFEPLFGYLNERKATAYVHHSPVPAQYDSLCTYNNLRRSYGRCVDQCIAVGRELFGGLFTKFPDIKLVHSMLGGGFFAYASLWLPHKARGSEPVSRFRDDNDLVREQLRTNLYFEMSHAQPWGKEQLECAVKVLGADHILFGSSYPVREQWLTEGVGFIRGLSITEEEKTLILGGNAQRLYHIGEV